MTVAVVLLPLRQIFQHVALLIVLLAGFLATGTAAAFHNAHHPATNRVHLIPGPVQLQDRGQFLEKPSPGGYAARIPRLQLFFRQREEEASRKSRQEVKSKIPDWVLKQLSSPDFSVPFIFALSDDNGGDCSVPLSSVVGSSANITATENNAKLTVIIRLMKHEDLRTVVRLCVAEFGSGSVSLGDLIRDFPFQNLGKARRKITDWWDQFALPVFIYITFLVKISERLPNDHALLVACLCRGQVMNSRSAANSRGEELVGLVELSRQPPERTRNPPAFPLPLWFKELYCRYKKIPKPDGWITNLLVAPNFRGQGYSKLLMAAAEGTANVWQCTGIYLHCDANSVSGKVPQALYRSLGYETIEDKNSPYSWMGTDFANKVVMVEGMPLLFMRKNVA